MRGCGVFVFLAHSIFILGSFGKEIPTFITVQNIAL